MLTANSASDAVDASPSHSSPQRLSGWAIREYAFTLARLKQPEEDGKKVLEAISRAARERPPEPREEYRAIAVTPLELDARALKPGYLSWEKAAGTGGSGGESG